jgi:hypothetical protein
VFSSFFSGPPRKFADLCNDRQLCQAQRSQKRSGAPCRCHIAFCLAGRLRAEVHPRPRNFLLAWQGPRREARQCITLLNLDRTSSLRKAPEDFALVYADSS